MKETQNYVEGDKHDSDRKKMGQSKDKRVAFIYAVDNCGSSGKLMNLEGGWKISPVWNVFKARVRMEIKKSRI